MLLRSVDAFGDILPVLSSSDLVSGAEAVVILVRDRLASGPDGGGEPERHVLPGDHPEPQCGRGYGIRTVEM